MCACLFQGKPTLLESQFRLTYSMILNLLRVEQLRVEDMMKRSFSEFHNQRDITKRQQMLETVTQKIKEAPDIVDYSGDLEDYYVACDSYSKLKLELQVSQIVNSFCTYKCVTFLHFY